MAGVVWKTVVVRSAVVNEDPGMLEIAIHSLGAVIERLNLDLKQGSSRRGSAFLAEMGWKSVVIISFPSLVQW